METILEKIKKISERAAEELREEGFISDTEIRTLDRQDLCELLPGKAQLKVRKEIFQLISQVPPQRNTKHSIDDINIRGLIPPDSFENAPSEQGPLLEYLQLLKDHRIYLMYVKGLIEAQIDTLERARRNSPDESNYQEYATNSDDPPIHFSPPEASSAAPPTWSVSNLWPKQQRQDDPPMNRSPPEASSAAPPTWSVSNLWPKQQRQDDPPMNRSPPEASSAAPPTWSVSNLWPKQQRQAHVTYKMVVSGKTLGTHLKVLEKLNGPIPGHSESLQLQKTNDEDCQVIIVFCPVVSRAGTDVEAALREVCGDKPIILVAMHHMHSPSGLPPPRTNSKVVLGVNVFFHETANGLLPCSQNESALNDMKVKLHDYSKKRSCLNLKRGTKY
ncbi:unnamed protein product [Knipowitschia caucasica]